MHEALLDMCCYNLTSKDIQGIGLARKSTHVISDCLVICDHISRRCTKDHRHVQLASGLAAAAQEYTPEFVDAVLTGLQIHMLGDQQRRLVRRRH